jgi:hypothetical protein
MSTRTMRTRQTKQAMRGYLNEINAIAENASQVDKDGKWGLDGWIRTIHDLVDLQVRTAAGVLQMGLAGPWWVTPAEHSVDPTEVDVSPAVDYPQMVSASPFARVGYPDTVIPAYSIDLEPDVLPAGAATLTIALKDTRFVGANYTGKITLRSALDATAASRIIEVTVGL